MVVGTKVCELTDGFLWFVCGLYVGILTSPLKAVTGFIGTLMGYNEWSLLEGYWEAMG